MQDFKIGDSVAVLHDTVKGRIIEMDAGTAVIEATDGFNRKYLLSQLVPQTTKQAYKIDQHVISKDAQKIMNRTTEVVRVVKETPFEIDLHIEELRDTHEHLTNYEIVQAQLNACRAFVQKALAAGQRKIVLIHGKGEGVLKTEIHRYLDRLANDKGMHIEYLDAAYSRYGQGGATEVRFGY